MFSETLEPVEAGCGVMDGEDQPASTSAVGEKILGYFWDLAAVKEANRIAAADGISQQLVQDQLQFSDESAGSPASSLPGCSPSVDYTVKRLLRGLESSRQAARQGFALALTNVLQQIPAVPTQATLEALEAALEISNRMKGTDARNVLLGRIFGYAAFARAGRLHESVELSRCVEALVDAMKGKMYLREAAARVLVLLLEALPSQQLLQVMEAAPGLRALLTSPVEQSSPEGLWLALCLWHNLPSSTLADMPMLPDNVPPPHAGLFSPHLPTAKQSAPQQSRETADGFFNTSHLQSLLPLLAASSHSHPKLHSLWPTMLALLVPGFNLGKAAAELRAPQLPLPGPDNSHLEALWSIVVEGELFASSHERKALGLQLFSVLLPHLRGRSSQCSYAFFASGSHLRMAGFCEAEDDCRSLVCVRSAAERLGQLAARPEHVPIVFSPLCLRTLSDSLSHEDAHLRPLAQQCIKGLTTFLDSSTDKGLRVAVVVALQRQGGIGFDRIAGTKLTARLLEGLDAEGIALYLQQLPQAFLQCEPQVAPPQAAPGDTEDELQADAAALVSAVNARRAWIIEQMTAAARLPNSAEESVVEAAKFLSLHAFCTVPSAGKDEDDLIKAAATLSPPLSPATRQLCAARLITLLGSVFKPHNTRKRNAPAQGDSAVQGGDDPAGSEAASAKKSKRRKTSDSAAIGVGRVQGDAKHAPPQQVKGDVILAQVLGLLERAETSKDEALSLSTTIPQNVAEAAARLSAIAQRLRRTSGIAAAAASAGRKASAAEPAAVSRSFAQLLGLLHMYFLADPGSAQPDLADDLDGIISDIIPPGPEGRISASGEGQAPAMDRLMDVILSLLAGAGGELPFAPLREAIEGLFKQCCPMLTPTGLQDLLRVVMQPLDGGGREDEDDALEAEDDDDDEEEQEAVAGADDRSSEQAGSDAESSDESAEDESDASGDEQAAIPDGNLGREDQDGGSEGSDEDMTDEQMFRMNAALSAAVKSATEGKSKASRKALRESLVDFKFRVLSLLECFVKRMPGSPLIAASVPLLLQALRGLSGPEGHAQLSARIAALIETKIARAKPGKGDEVSTPTPQELSQQLEEVRRLLSREREPVVVAAGTSGFLYLLRAAVAAGKASEAHLKVATQALDAALSDAFQSKSSHLPSKLLAEAGRRFPHVARSHWAKLTKFCASARSEFLRQQALELVLVLLRVPQEQGQMVPQPDEALSAALCSAIHGAFTKGSRQVAALKLVVSCLQAIPSVDSIDKAALKASVEAAQATSPSEKVTAQLQRISSLLGLPPPKHTAPHSGADAISEQQIKPAKVNTKTTSSKKPLADQREAGQNNPPSATPSQGNTERAGVSGKQQAKKLKQQAGQRAGHRRDTSHAQEQRAGHVGVQVIAGVQKRKVRHNVRKGSKARAAALQAQVKAAVVD